MKKSLPELMLPVLLVVLGICLCAATGCTSTSSDTTSPDATFAPATPTAPGTAKGSVTAVPFATLMIFLPDAPAGWTAEEPAGATWTVEDGQWSFASCGYARGDTQVVVVLQDSAYYDVGYWQLWDTLTSIETSDGYYRQGRVSGHPSWECFSKPATYTAWVGVNERFMVYVGVEDGSRQDLDSFVNAIDYRGIEALK